MIDPKFQPLLDWTPELVVEFWKEIEKFPDYYFTNTHGKYLARWLSHHLPPSSSVVDYGAGVGYLLPHLLNKGFKVASADINKPSLKAVPEVFDHQNFIENYIVEDLLKQEKKFDAVTLIEVIEHLPDGVLESVLSNIKNLLNKDGKFFVTTPYNEDLSAAMTFCPISKTWFHRWQHVRSWDETSLQQTLSQAGFKVELCEATKLGSFQDSPFKTKLKLFYKKKKRLPHLIAVASPL